MTATAVPPLDDFADEWVDAGDLAHLHSLRNQWGQAHVNADLTSLSWLALPPFSGGYRTGVLRGDDRVIAADAFSWAPWGVRRCGAADGVAIETDTRLAFEGAEVLWSVRLRNDSEAARTVVVEQELLAPIAHSEVDWGWLYGTPWNHGHHHDFFTTERIRADVLTDRPGQPQFAADDLRHVRLGRPRVAGIQRDEDDAPMLLDTALPTHFTPDSPSWRRAPSAAVVMSSLRVGAVGFDGAWELRGADDEVRLAPVALGAGSVLAVTVAVTEVRDGVILTHGNHPDSLQLSLRDGEVIATIAGELLRSGRRLVPGERVRVEVAVHDDRAELSLDGELRATTTPWWGGQRWTAAEQDGAVLVVDTASSTRSAFAFASPPDELVVEGQRALARWRVALAPGASARLGVALAIGDDVDEVRLRASDVARSFAGAVDAVADAWRRLWRNAFTPGNPDHSGHVPTLTTDDGGLARTYHLGILLMLYMRNTRVSPIGPVFLTGGPRLGPTTTFYWDQSEWARLGAMLEPAGIRSWILAALAQPYDRSHSFDTRGLQPVGNHYAANDHALFTIVERYVGVTGDLALLDESAAGRTVLDHLRGMADRARTQRARFGDGVLVDLGRDAWELLECVPNYRDAVVSFNAGYVGILRGLAALLARRGDDDEAARARADAGELAAAVLGQYAGGGRWRIAHPDGDETIGHCLDVELVAAHLADDLTAAQRAETVAFVREHLLDGDWMRALAPDDPIAPFSDRPDHGAAGAFAAWPGSTSYALARLGEPDVAAAFLSRVHRSRSGALWGQAVESVGAGRFRVAERGVANRDSNAASAVSEAIVAGLFGIEAGFGAVSGDPSGATETRFGTLSNVRAVGFDLPSPAEAAPAATRR